ncbi:MAG: hypothetical protein R6W31_18545 [Bacteroidales bacterium]
MKRYFILVCLPLFCQFILLAQEEPEVADLGDTIRINADLFEGPEPLEMTLTFDVKRYLREKNSDEYLPVDLLLHFNDTIDIEKSVRIKSRGEFRKNTCYFVPFWLNIRKADVENKYLKEVTKMKVVTHCRAGDAYEDYVLLEFLAYKIYNLLSPVSFRVRLILMKYVDTGRNNKVTESWAFLIEPEEMLAGRSGGLVIENDGLGMVHMRREEMLRAALFQFMIGNCDYSIAGRHNMKLLGLPGFGTQGYTPVPYDFDYAGFVNASYAVPGENLGISSVTQRYYLGPCREDAEYLSAIQYMEDHREEILELIQGFPYLGEKARNSAIGYIESYFTEASDPRLSSPCSRASRTSPVNG